jgi:hypothetical protein
MHPLVAIGLVFLAEIASTPSSPSFARTLELASPDVLNGRDYGQQLGGGAG